MALQPKPMSKKFSRFAISSLLLSCFWFALPCLGSLGGIVCGFMALREIKSDPRLKGRSLAIVGIIIGLISLMILPFSGYILLYFLGH
jgi:hypothetical protein